ncbi:hypothetical protein AgCh_029172 [Apium graveolens]
MLRRDPRRTNREFDVILGMDWLSSHGAQIDCERKKVRIRVQNGKEIVFKENLQGFPPDRDIEFVIELAPRMTPVSKAPYRLALVQMKELASQLQELLDNKMIRTSVLPWGTPVLFVKKKDDCIERGPHVPMRAATGNEPSVPKPRHEWSDPDIEQVRKDKKAMNILFNGVDGDMFDNIINCKTAKEVWDTIQIICDGAEQVRENKMRLLIQ